MKKRTMPLYIKILFIVFINVYIVCWIFAWQVIRSSQDILLEKYVGSAVKGHGTLCDNIESFSENFYQLTSGGISIHPVNKVVREGADSYDGKYHNPLVTFEIKDNSGGLVYRSQGDEAVNIHELTVPQDGTVTYQLQYTSERSTLAVSSWLEIKRQLFKVNYWEDITELIRTQHTFSRRAGAMLAGLSVILLFSLYFGIRYALRPLQELGEKARSIAKGDYSLRADVTQQDEVGLLAEEFNHMADAVEHRTEMLEETARLRELYAANLAHEIKSPMTSIIGYTEMAMLLQPDPERLYEMLSYINREGKRLDALSGALLQWTSLNHDKEISARLFSVERMLEHLRQIVEPLLEEEGQKLVTENELNQMWGDENLIITLLRNLISNGARASEKGGLIYLRLKTGTDTEECVMMVEDKGIGMDKDSLKRIKEPFYMIDKARSRAHQGAGLGLALCEAIVQAHGGQMDIRSEAEKGTCVTITGFLCKSP
ncbi:MAG: HAMP domain-containing sensor histidine kinase [Eubacteriales bacterium]|nr:HAMP domain-containing sensor histidine kinase [Eubacteriales bacterium]